MCKNIFSGCPSPEKVKKFNALFSRNFSTSTPVQSDEELSDNDEVMEQDDDPSYVPDPEEIDVDANDDDIGFDDFDDRLYEYVMRNICLTAPKHYGPNVLYQKNKCFKRKSLQKIHYIIHRESPKNAPTHQQNLFLVAESSLLGLFRFCPVAGRNVKGRLIQDLVQK